MNQAYTPVFNRVSRETELLFLLQRLKRHAPDIYQHSLRVASLFEQAVRGMNMTERELDISVRSALLHDIGYLHISPREESERENHPELGMKMIDHLGLSERVDREMIVSHHENLDGTGYPHGIGWNELSLNTRMLRIVDYLDNHTAGVYSPGHIHSAMEELFRWSDMLFDSELVDVLCDRWTSYSSTVISMGNKYT